MASLRRTARPEVEGGLIQRCVIVQRDDSGYGLTVSGDNPVYVQSVKDYGAAYKAGVQVHDRIIKVNGVGVVNSNHIEVVKLIKSGSYVALTLLGKPPGTGEKSNGSTDKPITQTQAGSPTPPPPPPPVSNAFPKELGWKPNDKVGDLQRMLDQEQTFHVKVRDEYLQDPSQQKQKELADCQTRIRALEGQIKALTGGAPKSPPGVPFVKQPSLKSVPETSPKQHQRSQSTATIKPSAFVKHSNFASDYPPSPYDHNEHVNSSDQDKNQRGKNNLENASQPDEKQPIVRSSSGKAFGTGQLTNVQKPNSTDFSPLTEAKSSEQNSLHMSHIRTKSDDSEEAGPVMAKRPFSVPGLIHAGSVDEGGMPIDMFSGGEIKLTQPLQSAMSVISMEEDEFDSDNEKIDDHGPFLDMNILKNKPAHLAVFLHFLMSNSDPSALFFWLMTETYAKEEGSLKDLRKWAYEIFSSFLASSAPLKVCIPEGMEQTIEDNLSKTLSEEDFRNLFRTARLFAFTEVNEELADFRNKRSLGLGSLFGDHQLEDNLDRDKELKVVEQTLLPHLEALTVEVDSNAVGSHQNDRNSAMASALTTFMKHVGVSIKSGDSRTNPLERHRSFAEKERSSLWKKKKVIKSVKGHQFVETQYTSSTICHHCNSLLWGIGAQGYHCQVCEYNVHKRSCVDSLEDHCRGSKSKKVMTKPEPHRIFDWNKSTGKEGKANTRHTSSTSSGKTDKDLSIDEESGEHFTPSDTRQRGSSFAELSTSMTSGDEPAFSDQEQDKPERSPGPFNADENSNAKIRGTDIPKSTTKLNHSQSVRSPSQREFVRLIDKDRKKTLTSLPGLPGMKIGMLSENGVYTPHPFPGPTRVDSPPVTDEVEEEYDSDLEIDTEVPNWSETHKKVIKRLKNKEVKRQEVIHELIHTEKTHVRNLKVLQKVFLRPMKKRQILTVDQINEIFPNLEELIDIHSVLLKTMETRKAEDEVVKNIGDIMLDRFDGAAGEQVRQTEAKFCMTQRISLEMLKSRQRKDPKFAQFLMQQEGHRLCKRLKFTDIMASSHQRLTKYPLLLGAIAKATPPLHEDHQAVEKCVGLCKETLKYVNSSIKECENHVRLLELAKKIEKKPMDILNNKMLEEVKTFNIKEHKLIHEGSLLWKISRTKSIDLHVLLLDSLLVLLQRQDDKDEKYMLKSHNTTLSTGVQEMKTTHSPVLKLQNLLTRNVATDKRAFFLVSTSKVGPQIYELVAPTSTERKIWIRVITECVEIIVRKAGRGRRGGLALTSTPVPLQDLPIKEKPDETSRKESDDEKEREPDSDKEENGADSDEHEGKKTPVPKEKPVIRRPCKERIAELYEQLRSKDEELKRIFEEKEKIVTELRGQTPGLMILAEASITEIQHEPRELALAAILQANRLTLAVSEIFNMQHRSEGNGSQEVPSTSPVSHSPIHSREDSLNEDENVARRPQEVLLEATTALNEQLTSLLGVLTEKEISRERLTSEFQEAKIIIEQLKLDHSSLASQQLEDIADTVPTISTPSEEHSRCDILQLPAVDVFFDESDQDSSTNTDSTIENRNEDRTVISASHSHSLSADEDSLLMKSPFMIHTKSRTSDPALSIPPHLTNGKQQIGRSASFSGYGTM